MALIDKCVHYWKLDEYSAGTDPVSRADSHGSNTLTDYGTTASAAGIGNQCAQFDAFANTYLAMATPYNPGVGDFSVSIWLKWIAPNMGFFTTGATGDGVDGFGLLIAGSTTIRLFINDTVQTERTTIDLATGITTNVWHHLVVTFDRDGNATGWLDGIEQSSGSIASHQANLGATYGNIGRAATTSGDYTGLLDEIGIFNAVLTPDEIATLYGGGTPSEYPWTPANPVKVLFLNVSGTIKVVLTQAE